MSTKYQELDKQVLKKSLELPTFLLKIIPHANGKDLSICQLVRMQLKDIYIRGAWTGPADLQIFNHVQAALHHLPVLEIIKGYHFIIDVTLCPGEIILDYLK